MVAQSRVVQPSAVEKGVPMGATKPMGGKEGVPAGGWSLQGVGVQGGQPEHPGRRAAWCVVAKPA